MNLVFITFKYKTMPAEKTSAVISFVLLECAKNQDKRHLHFYPFERTRGEFKGKKMFRGGVDSYVTVFGGTRNGF